MNQVNDAFRDRTVTEAPRRARPGGVAGPQSMDTVIADLYAVISILDSENQSDLAGRLHALTLEIRERATMARTRQFS
jgi:hypothetical protein